jgi:hypothetical protein
VPRFQRDGSLRPYSRISRPELLFISFSVGIISSRSKIVAAYGILPHQVVSLVKLSEFKNDFFLMFETQDKAMWDAPVVPCLCRAMEMR